MGGMPSFRAQVITQILLTADTTHGILTQEDTAEEEDDGGGMARKLKQRQQQDQQQQQDGNATDDEANVRCIDDAAEVAAGKSP